MAESLWRHVHLYSESFNLLIYFNRVSIIPSPKKQLGEIFGIELFSLSRRQNFLVLIDWGKIENIFAEFESIEEAVGLNQSGEGFTLGESPSEVTDYNVPPLRISCNVTRFVRDTVKSIQLKTKYKYVCQIIVSRSIHVTMLKSIIFGL